MNEHSDTRVLFIDQSGSLGGGELSLLDIASDWQKTSEVVLFEDGPFRSRLESEGICVSVEAAGKSILQVRRENGFFSSIASIPELLRLVFRLSRRAKSANLLYANSQKAMIAASFAGWLAGKPVVWHLRDLMTDEHLSQSHRQIAIFVSNLLVDHVICNSAATHDAYVESGGSRKTSSVIHNGIDVAPFSALTLTDAHTMRSKVGVLPGTPLVGVFSRLAPWKGQHVLIRALPQLPDVHALIVGEALFDADRTYAEELRCEARQRGVESRTHFLGFRNDIPALMNAVDVVCHTSIAAEPFGRVIVEGMLAGKPVIATHAGGAIEIIDNEQTGFLVPPNDVGALAERLEMLLNNPRTASEIGKLAEQKALRRFSLKKTLRGIFQTISAVLKPS